MLRQKGHTWYRPSLNQPQGVKYREHLAPVDTLVRLKLPWQSTQVLPTMTLCAVLLGGTRLNTSPVLRSLIRDLPAGSSAGCCGFLCIWRLAAGPGSLAEAVVTCLGTLAGRW